MPPLLIKKKRIQRNMIVLQSRHDIDCQIQCQCFTKCEEYSHIFNFYFNSIFLFFVMIKKKNVKKMFHKKKKNTTALNINHEATFWKMTKIGESWHDMGGRLD